MLNINFKKENIIGFKLETKIKLDKSQLDAIRSLTTSTKVDEIMFLQQFSVENSTIGVFASVKKWGKIQDNYKIVILGGIERPAKIGKTSEIDRLFKVLTQLNQSFTFECTLTRAFRKPKQHKDLLIHFPIVVSTSTNSAFNEIRGFHFVKKTDGTSPINLYVDTDDYNSLQIVANYQQFGFFNESLLNDVIGIGIKYTEKFVFRN